MSRNGPRVSPTIWALYVAYTLLMYMIATDFSPFTAPPKPTLQQRIAAQRPVSRPYDIPVPCDLSPARTAVAYVPEAVDKANDSSAPLDVLIVFHSKARSGWFAQKQTTWAAVAESHKLVVIWGTSTGGSHAMGGPNARWKSESSDFEYFQGLLRYALATWPRDKTRFFVTGIANGGFFASDLLQRYPDLVAGAYLSMAGLGRVTKLSLSKEPSPAPVYFVVGDNDPMRKKVEEAQQTYSAAGYPTKIVHVPGVGHDYQPFQEAQALEWLRGEAKLPYKSQADLRTDITVMDLRDWWSPCDGPTGKGWQCGAGACQSAGGGGDRPCSELVAGMMSRGEKLLCVCPRE